MSFSFLESICHLALNFGLNDLQKHFETDMKVHGIYYNTPDKPVQQRESEAVSQSSHTHSMDGLDLKVHWLTRRDMQACGEQDF